MRASKKSKEKSLKEACWAIGKTITQVCKDLRISRWTAYRAWGGDTRVPEAAASLFEKVGSPDA